VLRVGLRKKIRPNSHHKSPEYFFIKKSRFDFNDIQHNLLVSKGSKVETLSPSWDLLTRVGVPYEPALILVHRRIYHKPPILIHRVS
jgi:hypothetical protein